MRLLDLEWYRTLFGFIRKGNAYSPAEIARTKKLQNELDEVYCSQLLRLVAGSLQTQLKK